MTNTKTNKTYTIVVPVNGFEIYRVDAPNEQEALRLYDEGLAHHHDTDISSSSSPYIHY